MFPNRIIQHLATKGCAEVNQCTNLLDFVSVSKTGGVVSKHTIQKHWEVSERQMGANAFMGGSLFRYFKSCRAGGTMSNTVW